ncbi:MULTISPECIES: hypothetical protein [unclassified Amycolatopsis]|uniref:hypothetical protein n=1 Tax=unclassified Amycolatopsis TaxID=2618356 RepID=UPI001C6A04E6|nr:hypothetical protein [Amycolatopsis sp. DSM 110486]QYN19026.1 hypothetical protein K1T34_41135 [Amycolatopsis sp. DSM 110486]
MVVAANYSAGLPCVYSTQSFADDHKLIAPPTVPVPGAIADPDTRIEIKQESTGPVVTYRRWFRREAVRTLIPGDVRTLLARVYERACRSTSTRSQLCTLFRIGVPHERVGELLTSRTEGSRHGREIYSCRPSPQG